jgi:serine/threonine protein kinase
VVSNVSSLIDTNINDDFEKAMKDKNVPWIILKLAHGCSLREFIQGFKRDIGLHEAIKFCINLLNITRSFHVCGVVHRDLKPDNIYIDCSGNSSLGEGNITVLDFGLAYIEKNPLPDDNDLDKTEFIRSEIEYTTSTGDPIGNGWYRVPQLAGQKTSGLTAMQKNEIIQQRRSPSIDASSICGILYWLLTKEIPGEERAKHHESPPHQKIMRHQPSIWNDVVQQAIKLNGKC